MLEQFLFISFTKNGNEEQEIGSNWRAEDVCRLDIALVMEEVSTSEVSIIIYQRTSGGSCLIFWWDTLSNMWNKTFKF
jgi:hypothetical protein